MKIVHKKKLNTLIDLILPFKKGEIDQGIITDLTGITKVDFEGEFGQYQLVYSTSGSRVYLLGLGEEGKDNRAHEAFRKLIFKEKKHWKGDVQIDLRAMENKAYQAALGAEMSAYQIAMFKSEKEDVSEDINLIFICEKEIEEAISEGSMTGTSINRIKSLVDAPANVKTPEYLANWAEESGSANGYSTTIWDETKLSENGFGAIMAVGKGSQYPPRMIECKYLGKGGDNIDLALVGKGVTFDTGGISIKPSTNMHYMKSDMGGAAAVLGAVEVAAKLKLEVNIVGIICAAENAVDAKSFLPGDVIHSHSGKTIEIIDTDAEGRLVMADGISYVISSYAPEKLIDVATLTGSTVRTLGYYAGGLFTHNKQMSQDIQAIGDEIFERVWPLPIFDELKEDLHSDIADVRNFGGRPIAGASAAAKFLEFFTKEHESWVHLDIAGVAFGSSDYAKMKSSTGHGVRLLVEYIKTLQKK